MKSISEIINRAEVLYALCSVAFVALGYAKEAPSWEAREECREGVLMWLEMMGIASELTSEEMALLQTPCKEVPTQTLIHENMLNFQAIRPLLWMLGQDRLASYDGMDSNANGCPQDFLLQPGIKTLEELQEQCHMRSKEEIELQAMVAMLWHWRAIEADSILPTGKTWTGIVCEIFGEQAEKALEYIPHQTRGGKDFLVGKKPVSRLGAYKKFELLKSSEWRHRAFEWALGDEPWDEVSTDT